MRIGLVALLSLVVAGPAGSEQLKSIFLPGRGNQDVVLSDKPMVLGMRARRFTSAAPLKVMGVTSDFCVVLAKDVAKNANIDATVEKLKGGARLSAVLHEIGGSDVVWKCGGWSLSQDEFSRGTLSACLKWECNQAPPKGTEITSIDLTSSRPLHILGANWSSTDAFDDVSQPPPDRVAITSAEYRDLERSFGRKLAWLSPARTALQVVLSSNRRHTSFSTFNSTLAIRLAPEGIQIEPRPNTIGMGVVTIPTAAIAACSMSCSSDLARSVNLLLPVPGIEVDLLNSPEVINWCWRNRVPMATSASRRTWLYSGAPLPDKKSYAQQLNSHSAYNNQAHQSCMGY